MAPKFVFSGTGTRGDLIPMLAMAAEMARRGHDCHVLANDPSGGLARGFDVPFTSVAPAQTNNLTGVEGAFGNHVFPAYRPTFDFIEAELARGSEVVIVNAENYAGSTLMAERHGLPLCRFTLAPYRIFSVEEPFFPLSLKRHGRMGETYRRYVLPRLREERYSHPYIIARINEFRAGLGLAPLQSLLPLDRLVSYQVCLFPEWYCAPASDWPARLECVGFPLLPAKGALPARLARFIEEHGAPLVFTPGTGVVDVKHFFDAARVCCERLGKPGLFLSPNLAAAALEPSETILQLDYVDLALVLPHASLLVHHGGIGTTARAIEAGVPQIISPQAFDQPDNGDRVSRLKLGAMLARDRLSGEALSERAGALIECPEVRLALSRASLDIRSTNATASMADILERRFIAQPGRARAGLAGAARATFARSPSESCTAA